VAARTKWLSEATVVQQFGVTLDDVAELVATGELMALEFPSSGRRINADSVRRFERVRRRAGDSISLLVATDLIGRWALPSGRCVAIFVSPSGDGARRLSVFYDMPEPLPEPDARALQTEILPVAAERIYERPAHRG
jgi:hypothetical protein